MLARGLSSIDGAMALCRCDRCWIAGRLEIETNEALAMDANVSSMGAEIRRGQVLEMASSFIEGK